MLKNFLLSILSLLLVVDHFIYSKYPAFIELDATLNQLLGINNKIILSPYTQKLEHYPLPSQEFYTALKSALEEAFQGNLHLLNAYENIPSIRAVKYMFSISNELSIKSSRATDILLLVELFNRIQAKYKITETVIITSVSTGETLKEKILLKTLAYFGYKSIKFYAIDPQESTLNAIKNFSNDSALKNYSYQQFDDIQYYIKKIIEIKKELPHVCLTFFPILYMNSTRNDFIPDKQNLCHNRSKNKKLTNMLIAPTNIDEISIASSDSTIVQEAQEILKNEPSLSFSLIKKKLTSLLGNPYQCDKNVLLNFLEIIKLSSSKNNDCIAYYKAGTAINTYYTIASKSIAQLYLETTSINKFYLGFFETDLKDFKLWNYNLVTKAFEYVNFT